MWRKRRAMASARTALRFFLLRRCNIIWGLKARAGRETKGYDRP